MAKILLDYVFKVSSITPAAAASTAFLKQACVVVAPKEAVPTGVITACTSQTQIAALTDNLEAQQLLNAGMSKVYILPMDDLDLATVMETATDFFTLIISSDFTTTDITTDLDVGTFRGVVGAFFDDEADAATFAATENRVGFFGNSTNKAKNLMFAFGKMLSNALNWRNQQYISMPVGSEVTDLGTADTLFDDGVSFVITDDEFSHRLGLLAAGGKAIVGPYIKRNLEIDLQSAALTYISANQPAYDLVAATLLENTLKDVVQDYIDRRWISAGTVAIALEQDDFVASGYINIAEPKALWRVFSEISQTL
jgi:hypothetical protein